MQTLKTQGIQFRAQLTAQSGALDAQLRAQAETLETQLAAQAAQASKERELAARAELIVSVHAFLGSSRDTHARGEACTRISNGLEKWRFELQSEEDRPLWLELDNWRSVLNGLMSRRYPTGDQVMLPVTGYELLLSSAGAQLMNALIEFRRNFACRNWTAEEIARVLREFRNTSLKAPV
jgi:hypothetical protein